MNRRRPLLFLVASGMALSACGTYVAPPPSTDAGPDPAGAASALADFVAALDGGSAGALSPPARTAVSNARALRVTGAQARYVDEAGATSVSGSWPASVAFGWRLGAGTGSSEQIIVTFGRRDGHVEIVGFGGAGNRVPLWLLTPVTVHRAPHVTVIAAGAGGATWQSRAETAVSQVRQVVPWPQADLVVEVPATEAQMEQVLGQSLGAEHGVAAVTGPEDGSARPDAAQHVFVNPEVVGTGTAAQIVLTHEATHAATSASAHPALPAWLREGFADYVALHAQRLPMSEMAGAALKTARGGGLPKTLPADTDFNAEASDFGEVYQFAWLACRLLGEMRGPEALYGFYEAVGNGTSVDAALRASYGIGLQAFTARWRTYVAALAR